MQLGLFFFGASNGAGDYTSLLDATRFADREGLEFVSTPERHFDPFGGMFPNPTVLTAALAMVTSRIQLRAGSLVLPLHDTVRVAEEWAVLDCLSGGRVAMSIGSGWNVNDFSLYPERYANRREHTVRELERLRALWRDGETVLTNGAGQRVKIVLHPRPRQRELPVWLTSSGNADTFARAGNLGANVLTHLENQDLATLAGKIQTYRSAWRDAGHAGEGRVTLMQHTFVSTDRRDRDAARDDLLAYLATALRLESSAVRDGGDMSGAKQVPRALFECGVRTRELAEAAAQRYADELSLVADPETARERLARLGELGVDEVACLVDFVIDPARMLRGLRQLPALNQRIAGSSARTQTSRLVDAFTAPHE